MSRVKTFDSTGVAPNGRLYAGDLNSIQDQYADLVNFLQTHGVGVLQVGDAAIQLLKFATGEARLTAALRTDGIVRGLGGLFAGGFTTTQRDNIPAGSRPYGLLILNTTTNRFEFNSLNDAVPRWVPVGSNELGYTERTTTVSVSNATVDVVETTVIHSGVGAGVSVEFFSPEVNSGDATQTLWFKLEENGAARGVIGKVSDPSAGSVCLRRRLPAPAIGATIYKVTVSQTGAASPTGSVKAGDGTTVNLVPTFIRVSNV